MVRELKILETNLKFEEITKFISYIFRFHCVCGKDCPVFLNFTSGKRYSIREVLKCISFRNPGIAKVLAVEMELNPRNMNFTKVVNSGGGGGAINREGAFVWINTVVQKSSFFESPLSSIKSTNQAFCVSPSASIHQGPGAIFLFHTSNIP